MCQRTVSRRRRSGYFCMRGMSAAGGGWRINARGWRRNVYRGIADSRELTGHRAGGAKITRTYRASPGSKGWGWGRAGRQRVLKRASKGWGVTKDF